jgi:hypothetical protein
MNSEVIILLSTISTGLLGLMALCIRYGFLSKCKYFKCCCCEIERDVNLENAQRDMNPQNLYKIESPESNNNNDIV